MKFTHTALAAFTTVALSLTAQAETKSILLKQSMPIGKRLVQSMTMNQKMNMEGGPQAIKITNKINMDMSMDVTKHGEDQKKATIKYDKASMLMDMGFMKEEVSSENDDGNPFTKLVGKSFAVIYDKEDKIVEVKGADDLIGDAADLGPMASVAEMFQGDQMKQNLEQGLLQNVPKKALKVGDSWDFEIKINMPNNMGEMVFEGGYTLRKFAEYDGQECAVIAMEGKLEGDGKKEIEMQGQKISMDFKESEIEGEIYFDNKLGLPRKSDTLTKMKMEMAVAGQEMLMDMTITAINKVTKVEDLKN
jgi:hypothetical protein